MGWYENGILQHGYATLGKNYLGSTVWLSNHRFCGILAARLEPATISRIKFHLFFKKKPPIRKPESFRFRTNEFYDKKGKDNCSKAQANIAKESRFG
jgi:hypothetical protein